MSTVKVYLFCKHVSISVQLQYGVKIALGVRKGVLKTNLHLPGLDVAHGQLGIADYL